MKKLSFALLLSLLLTSCAQPIPNTVPDAWYGGYAERELVPEDVNEHEYYVAGYRNDNVASGVLDNQKAKAVYLEAGEEKVLFIAIDCIGLSSSQVEKIKKAARLDGDIAVHVVSTHTHAGIDTFGLWGPVAVDGKDEEFSRQLTEKAAEAAREAVKTKSKGKLYYGKTAEGIENLQEDSRTPFVYDKNLYQLRFEAEDSEKKSFRIIDYGAHAESLRSQNSRISADFPRYLTDAVKRECGDEVIFFPGAVGGLIMTKRLAFKDGTEYPVTKNAEETGKLLARAALGIENETELEAELKTVSKEVEIPLDNKVFIAMASLGILTNEFETEGGGQYGMNVKTAVSLTRIGGIYFVSVPGELFPELAYGVGDELGVTRTVAEIIDGEFVIVGLCDDEIGYIVTPSDFLLDEKEPYLKEAVESDGREHYEETNSVGIEAAEKILSAIAELYEIING